MTNREDRGPREPESSPPQQGRRRLLGLVAARTSIPTVAGRRQFALSPSLAATVSASVTAATPSTR